MKILIPAYEPSSKFVKLVDELKNLTSTEIIVINDGSGNNYDEVFSEIAKRDIKILKHNENKGKGEAIKTGIKYLKEINENEGCVLADCDGQHTPKDILKVMKKLKENNVDMVLGVRNFQGEKNQPKIQTLLHG